MELITIPLSHFCEKARWALDHAGLRYRERPYAPVLHRFVVRRRGSRTVPVLVDGRRVVRGSSEILALADQRCPPTRRLHPSAAPARAEVDALIARFDEGLGPQTRLWFYSWILQDRSRLVLYASLGVPAGQRALLRALAPGMAKLLTAYFGVTPDTHDRTVQRLDEEFAAVSERLADGRPHLCGESFGAADLTFAALAAPVLAPPGYGGGTVAMPPMPPALVAESARWRETPAGRHVLAVYRGRRTAAPQGA